MTDLKSPRLIWAKGLLLFALGCMAAALVLVEAPSLKVALLLAVAVWAFCRAYYFAFYVIEKYVDPGYRFAGIISFLKYAAGKRRTAG